MSRKKIESARFIFLLILGCVLYTQQVSAQFISPPTLVSPGNGSTNLTAPVTLTWQSSGSSFHIQVATDASFNNLAVDVSGITNQSYVLNTLTNSTTYYWRVNASSLLFTSGWSSVWNFTTAAGQTIPSAPLLISPANGSTNQATTIVLSWNSSTGADHYWIQIAKDQLFSTPTIGDSSIRGTTYQANNLAASTTYYWRVKGINSAGSSSWSSVWSFTTVSGQIQPPSQPTLISPMDKSTNQPTSIMFTWNAVTNADHYFIQVATDQTFSNMFYTNYAVTGTSQQVNGLQNNTTYFWQVRAVNAGGNSPWSSTWSFTTALQATLGTPTLSSPANGAANQSTTPTLIWNSVTNAANYHLQAAKDAAFNNKVFDDSTITSTSKQIGPLAYSTQYFWRVNAKNSTSISSWSSVWNFTTVTAQTIPSAPVLTSPANGSADQPLNPVLSWNSVSNADKYRLQIAKDASFSYKIFDDSTIISNYKQISALTQATQYFWRVNAKNNAGVSSWSSVWNFTTVSQQTIPSAPVLASPAKGTTDEPLNPVLSWNSVSTANKYMLQIAADSSFSNVIYNDSTITSNSKQVGPLTPATQYFWRVNARNNAGVGNWSLVWSFTTLNNENFVPVLISPSDGIGNVALTTLCVWNTIKNAQLYQIQISKQPDFSSVFISDSTSKTYRQLDNLDNNTTYYWRVRAKVTNNWHQYSSLWRFTTRSSTPTYINIDTTITFPSYEELSTYKSSDYKIIGIPGTSNMPITNFLTGTRLQDWQAYWDNGAPDNYLLDYNENNFFYSTGKAFWIIKKGPLKIKATVENAPLNNNSNVEIPLHSGWNMITNPLVSSIAWDLIKTINKITEPIYSFNGSFNISSTFKPFEGYYFFNSTNLSVLEVPSKIPKTVAYAVKNNLHKQTDDNEWTVNIKLNMDGYTDSTAWFGVSPLVSNNFNHLDIHKPRNWGAMPTIYFLHPDWDKDYPTFASDIKPSLINSFEWSFELLSPTWKQVTLTFDLKEVPNNMKIFLFDTKANRWVNLKEIPFAEGIGRQYQFTPVTAPTSFKIIASKVVPDNLTVTVPSNFKLGNNYPNPFNPSTTIPVSIPVKSEVEISVYDIIGNLIKTIYQGTLNTGEHWFRWNGTDNNGNVVSSGIYFYRLSDHSTVNVTKKMILMK